MTLCPFFSSNGGSCGSRVGMLLGAWDSVAKPFPRSRPLMGPWWSIDMDVRLGGYTGAHPNKKHTQMCWESPKGQAHPD